MLPRRLPTGTSTLPTATRLRFSHPVYYFYFLVLLYITKAGWRDLLARFASGSGTLLDLEFLVNEQGNLGIIIVIVVILHES
jgi:hypothetical protein